MNGRRQVLSYGPMGIVWFSLVSLSPLSMTSGFTAGSGKSILWWVIIQPTCLDIAYIGDQFFDHKGHRIRACYRISHSGLSLL